MRNLKKVIALVAVFAMMVSTVAFAQSFSDVDVEHDYFEAIEMLSNLDILTGDDADGDGTMDFRAEDKITRAEVATIISRIQGINGAAQVATDFVDVPATHWASGFVAQAAGQGIVNGYGDGNFGPEDNVTYEQAIKMLMVTIGYEPFAAASGGYPTGYLTAAQRYGVADGVIGASTGVEATRGQIAQLVYNAIDTPLMDSATWGANAEYVIYNGKGDYDFETLLTRDLGVVKFTGLVTANEITTLDEFKSINTEDDAEISIDADASTTNLNYEVAKADGTDLITTWYPGESGIGALIGKYVTGYAVEEGKDEYTVIAATETAVNKTMTIGLSQFVDLAANELKYWKNESDREPSVENISTSVKMLLNGVAVKSTDMAARINDLKTEKAWSGAITLIESNSKVKGYDVIAIEVGTPVVVDEVSANGKVSLKNTSAKAIDDKRINLVFNEEDTEQIIVLTKGGVEIDYTELAEWDVLSVLANKYNDYIVAEVIEAGKVEGRVSSVADSTTSDTGSKYTIDGTAYDVAEYAHECDALAPGSEGIFYIDAYGKIVAYSETGSAVASDKYAFIIKAKQVSDGWDGTAIKVELLDKSGEVYSAYLADKVKVENKDKSAFIKEAKRAGYTTNSYKAEDIDATLFEALVKSAFVTYEANSDGEIKALTFPQTSADENELYYELAKHYDATADYDAEDRVIALNGKKYDVDDETLVFYMYNATDGVVATNGAIAKDSKVDTIASLNTGSYKAFIYDANQDTVPVIVLYDTKGGLDKASNIALIDSVGQAVVGEEIVDSVTFFKDGEKFTATTDLDLDITFVAGEVYKLALSADGTVITGAEKYGTVDLTRTADKTGVEGTATFTAVADAGLEKTYFGPVLNYVSSKDIIRIAPVSSGLGGDRAYDADVVYNFADYTAIKAADANVYVIDPVRATNKISVGYASDVNFDEEVITAVAGGKAIDFEKNAYDIAAGVDALGMMDFVVAYEYDDEITDVIIIKAYDFGYDWEVKASL